jgi:membrane protease YdiL (CAAX protease family)
MSASDPIETGRDRAALTREAGIGKLSFISVLAGVLVAYGAFAVLAALAAAAAAAIGLNTDLSANNWAELGVGSAIVAAVVLLLAYLFGGYVAGRMARRAGPIHGLAVCILAWSSWPSSRPSPRPRPTPARSAATCAAWEFPPPGPSGATSAPWPESARLPPCWLAPCLAGCSVSDGTPS